MKVAAPAGSDDGGGSDSTCSIIYVQKTGERVTFKAMPVKTPDRKRKLLEHQRLKVQRRPPKPTPEYDALVVPWSDPMEPEDCSDITSITTKTETSGSDDDDSDSVSSWTSTITVQKPKATYSRTPQKIVPPPPPPPPPPENTDGGNQGRRRLHIEELEIDFTIEELSRVECLHFYAPGYETLPKLIIERYPEPEPPTKCRKMHELSDDWERFEIDLPQFSAEREYIHDKRLRLLTMGLEPPRRFIGDGNQFSLHEFLIAQAQFLMDMPGYDPENDFPLRKIYDLKTMKYKAKTDGFKPKIDSKDDSSPKQFNVQDSMDTKDDTTLLSLQSTQTDDDDDSRLLKEEPISDMLNEEDEESDEADMQNPEQDEDDSQNSDEEEDLENSDQELEEDMENTDQDDDGSQNADTDEDGTDNEGGYNSDEKFDSDDMEEDK